MGPGTCKVARLDGNENAFGQTFFFILFSFRSHLIFLFSLLTFQLFSMFLFLKTQPTRAVAVKCVGSVYHYRCRCKTIMYLTHKRIK